jgi:hypothetical protein
MLCAGRRRFALAVLFGLISACSSPIHPSNPTNETSDNTLAVPAFSIRVKLSEAAERKLESIHESLLVMAYFDGDPLPGKGKDNSPMRGVFLGNDEKSVDANNVATFADTKISQKTGTISPIKTTT